jgi:hypothetical protein
MCVDYKKRRRRGGSPLLISSRWRKLKTPAAARSGATWESLSRRRPARKPCRCLEYCRFRFRLACAWPCRHASLGCELAHQRQAAASGVQHAKRLAPQPNPSSRHGVFQIKAEFFASATARRAACGVATRWEWAKVQGHVSGEQRMQHAPPPPPSVCAAKVGPPTNNALIAVL